MLTCLMFKKHIIFQILYIIVVPLCPASLKRFVFYNPKSEKVGTVWKTQIKKESSDF